MKILVVTPYLPHRHIGHGGGTAVRDLVASLASQHEVYVAALVRPHESEHIAAVEELGANVIPLPFHDRTARGKQRLRLLATRTAAAGRSLISGYPLYVEKYWSAQLSRRLQEVVDAVAPDAVQVEYLQMALLCRDLRHQRDRTGRSWPRLVLNSHELGSLPRERRARRASNPVVRLSALREARQWRRLQVAATGWADTTLCVTPQDHDLYAALGGRNLRTVPLGMNTAAIRAEWAPTNPPRLLFLGSFDHRPNRLAADFLLKRMWPTVSVRQPDLQLVLAGRGSRDFLARLSGRIDAEDRVQALGFVEDLTPWFRKCRCFVAPLAEGGGIKIKILEAMARGIPVITTDVGAEGICSTGDNALVIAPCDDSFAEAVIGVMADPQDAAERAARGRKIIEEEFSWSAITRQLVAIYEGA